MAEGKETKVHAGTAEVARMTSRAAAGQTVVLVGIIKQQGRQRCRQRMGHRREQLGTMWGTVRTKDKSVTAWQVTKKRQGRVRQSDWSAPVDTGKFSTHVSMLCVDDASDSDWVAQSDGTQREEDLHFFMVNESSVQSQGCETHWV